MSSYGKECLDLTKKEEIWTSHLASEAVELWSQSKNDSLGEKKTRQREVAAKMETIL